jgi:hypothetical protein
MIRGTVFTPPDCGHFVTFVAQSGIVGPYRYACFALTVRHFSPLFATYLLILLHNTRYIGSWSADGAKTMKRSFHPNPGNPSCVPLLATLRQRAEQ